MTVVVHMIGNAHIDPVWLWGWQSGVDEALATFSAAADRCDEYADFVFTRGEAWLYQQAERLRPDLFERIRKHVADGRWSIVGGTYVQPDLNLPTEMALRRQIRHGQTFFQDRFGVRPRIGYNVDSFGHPAFLPDLLVEQGYTAYVLGRPDQRQMDIPFTAFGLARSGRGGVADVSCYPRLCPQPTGPA
jgi:alpha-mannosidase